MNTLHLTSILLLMSLLLASLFAASVKVLFTDAELDEMGICIGQVEAATDGMTV